MTPADRSYMSLKDELKRQWADLLYERRLNRSLNERADKAEAERDALKDQVRVLVELLKKAQNYLPGSVTECNGYKCRESWCMSCNDEEDARQSYSRIYNISHEIDIALSGGKGEG